MKRIKRVKPSERYLVALKKRCAKATKKERSVMLDEFVKATGYQGKHAAEILSERYVLRAHGTTDPAVRTAIYTQAEQKEEPLPGLPYTCVRVPTGDSKTFMACFAAGIASKELLHADRCVVLWLVPSNAIREQTLAALRNPVKTPLGFSLQTSTDKFYPDCVCELNDGRYLVVEYKNATDWSNDENKEKRDLGELWEARSNGACLLIMPKGKDFDAMRAKVV